MSKAFWTKYENKILPDRKYSKEIYLIAMKLFFIFA